ncbi:MAG TPA: type II toxin-antitoxin system VapC family toxin [Candidatus Acidoferrales bacterium]|nr:type II toxin-antitoxin system VapC family toxin [Candidatus Acidoferrales bacterium]
MSAVLDTHTVLWYLENSKELSGVARITIEDAVRDARDVHVSAISLVETVYLVERRRLPLNALERLRSALNDPNSGLFIAPVNGSVADALPKIPRDVVPDMPDRIIAATALHLGLPLITRDRRLQSAGIQTIW